MADMNKFLIVDFLNFLTSLFYIMTARALFLNNFLLTLRRLHLIYIVCLKSAIFKLQPNFYNIAAIFKLFRTLLFFKKVTER